MRRDNQSGCDEVSRYVPATEFRQEVSAVNSIELIQRPSALRAVRVLVPSIASPARARAVGYPGAFGTAAAGSLTCQRFTAAERARITQVGRTHGVSTVSGYGAKEIDMASKLGTRNGFLAPASGVPPRGRPV